MVLFCLFMLYPIVSSLYYVTRKWKGMTNTFIGLGNFVRMANDKIFQAAVGHNFLFMFIQVPVMIFLALLLAVFLNQAIRRFRGPLRLAIFLPSITSLVVVSVLFRVLLQTNGFLNNVMLDAHLITEPIGWLNDAFWAKVTIMLAMTWRWTGYNMVFFLVGLQSLDQQIFEAAEVDGASKARQFFTITVPLLVPIILFSAVTSTSGTMQLFDEPNILTWPGRTVERHDDGGPVHLPAGLRRELGLRLRDVDVLRGGPHLGVVRLHPAPSPRRGEGEAMSVVRKFSVGRVAMWLVLLLGAAVSIFPFYWMLNGMTLNPNDVLKGVLVPGRELAINWEKATRNYNLPLFFLNSLKIALLTVVFGVVINSLAAFGFEKYRSRARERVFGVLLLTLIIPQIAIVIPMFKLFAYFKLLNTHVAIILPAVMSVFIIFFMRQNFRLFPTEIMEAARVDGASELSIFVRIVAPSMQASFASAAIYMFINQWNSYLWPLMTILTDAKKTLPIAMSSMMNAYTIEYGALMIIVCVSTVPVLVLFLTMQKQFVAGLMGSVK